MLNGTGDHALDGLPLEVTGIPVHRKADALFFLHTFDQYGRPQRREGQDPVVFQYTVRYADGQAVVIPVRLGIEVGHWLSADPRGLKGAALAWAAAFANDDSGEQAAVYQMEWRNPRPDVEVSSVDVSYGALGNRYGMPAVLALSAGAAPR
jgi:beta-galactosidase